MEKIKLIRAKNKYNKKYEGVDIKKISKNENREPLDWLLDNALSLEGIDDLFVAGYLMQTKEVKN